jgi:hypothetical protein
MLLKRAVRGSLACWPAVLLRRWQGPAQLHTRNYAVSGLDHGQEQNRQPVKFAPNEARWHDERPANAVLLACPGERRERKRFELTVPGLGR